MEARPRKSEEFTRVEAPAEAIETLVETVATPIARKGPSRRTLVAVASALALALGGAGWILTPGASESTDAAYVEADSTNVAPKVAGLIAEILVRDNQLVRAGDPLVRIDPEEYQAKLADAHANLADAEANLSSALAELTRLDSEEQLASANIRLAQTSIRSAEAESARANADRRRYEALAPDGFVSRRNLETVTTAAVTAEQDAAKTIAALGVAHDQAGVTRARRPMLVAAVAKAEARVASARAALDLARQDIDHTLIRAPISGVVGNRQAQTGDYVRAGSRLLTIVPTQSVYVTANFKETQTGRMIPGQKATIEVDAFPGKALTGTVDSLAPGSGSKFSLLPFEPGTGNFTKIVQRVPVRIRFDTGQPLVRRLRPGLSVTADVKVAG
jgi:membrane fusion protein (multidrug efflux system)